MDCRGRAETFQCSTWTQQCNLWGFHYSWDILGSCCWESWHKIRKAMPLQMVRILLLVFETSMAISSILATGRAIISIKTSELGLFPRGGIQDFLSRGAWLKNDLIDWYNVNCWKYIANNTADFVELWSYVRNLQLFTNKGEWVVCISCFLTLKEAVPVGHFISLQGWGRLLF